MLTKYCVADVDVEQADFEGNAMDAWLRGVYTNDAQTLGAGVFEGRSGHFEFEYPHDELVYVISGKYRLEDLVTGEVVEAEAGDLAVIPRGTKLRATIVEPMRCLYVTSPAWTG